MKKLLLLLALCLAGTILNKSENRFTSSDNKHNYNYSVQKNESCDFATFDFGSSSVSNSNVLNCKLFFNDLKVNSLSFNGNITLLHSQMFQNGCDLSLLLPLETGEFTTIIHTNQGDKKAFVYSSLSSHDGMYHISSLSKYSAEYSAGNIENQDKMDNNCDKTKDSTENDQKESGSRDIVSGRVYGYLYWKDEQNLSHPLIGTKVKLTFDASWGSVSTYTNSYGYYDLSFNNIWTLAAFKCYIHIYSDCDSCRVTDMNDVVYEKVELLTAFSNGGTKYYSHTFSVNNDGDVGRAMNIFTSIRNYADYARTLNNNNAIAKCSVRYPTNDGAFYLNGSNVIELGNESQRWTDFPAVFASWDVIGHEYGHHLQKHFFFRNYYGTHVSNQCNFLTYMKEQNPSDSSSYILPTSEYQQAKQQSLGLAWKESWPTFFSISSQYYFTNDTKSIETVGDSCYDAFNGVHLQLNDVRGFGESDEDTIICFLYQIWDSVNTGNDHLTLSPSDLWSIMVSSNPEYFYDFISAIYASNIIFSRNYLGLLLEEYNYSASNFIITANSSNYNVLPRFSWTKNGYDVTYKGHTYSLSNDLFDLVFYDDDLNYILLHFFEIFCCIFSI